MGLLEIMMIAVGLAMDAFAVSLAAGASGRIRSARPVFRIAFHFGLFQFAMPVLGWMAGTQIVDLIGAFDHWIAFGLLAVVGGRMLLPSQDGPETSKSSDPTRGLTLVMLSVATSIDALAVGLSLGVLRVGIWYPSVVIGLVTAGLSLAGVAIGLRTGHRLGPLMERIGGLVLIGIGLRILIEHLSMGI